MNQPPEGAEECSPGWSVGTGGPTRNPGSIERLTRQPRRGGGKSLTPEESAVSFPEIPLVVLDVMCLEECQEFFLKGDLVVMSFLIRNITPYGFRLGFAHRKGPISILPMKSTEL